MNVTLEACLLVAGSLGCSLLAYWLLLAKYHTLDSPSPQGDDGSRPAHSRHASTGPVSSGRRGPSRPPCKNCGKAPWAGGPEMLCAACEDARLDLFDEHARGQMDGVW